MPKSWVKKTNAALESRAVLPTTGVASFLESTVLPIPLEAVLVPLMQRRRDVLWWLAGAALVGCVVGAAVGYGIGAGLMASVGGPVVEALGWGEAFGRAEAAMATHGFLFVLTVSLAPVPFQVAMLAAGATGFSFGWFMLATVLSRAVRYFGLAFLVWWLGDRAEDFVKRHKVLAIVGVVVGLGLTWGLAVG